MKLENAAGSDVGYAGLLLRAEYAKRVEHSDVTSTHRGFPVFTVLVKAFTVPGRCYLAFADVGAGKLRDAPSVSKELAEARMRL